MTYRKKYALILGLFGSLLLIRAGEYVVDYRFGDQDGHFSTPWLLNGVAFIYSVILAVMILFVTLRIHNLLSAQYSFVAKKFPDLSDTAFRIGIVLVSLVFYVLQGYVLLWGIGKILAFEPGRIHWTVMIFSATLFGIVMLGRLTRYSQKHAKTVRFDQQRADPQKWFEQNPKKTLLAVVVVFSMLLIGSVEFILSFYPAPPLSQSGSEYNTNRYIQLKERKPNSSIVLVPSETRLSISDGLKNTEYPFKIDTNGFVSPSIIHDKPDLTLVFLGGSTTECAYVQEEKRFPYLVGRTLEVFTHQKVNSINAGMSGSMSLNSINAFLNKILPFDPDIAVLMQNINDIVALLYDRTYWGINLSQRSPIVIIEHKQEEPPTLRTLLEDSFQVCIPHITQHMLRMKKRLLEEEDEADEFAHVNAEDMIIDGAYKQYMVTEFRKNLGTFIEICRVREITPVLMTQANRFKEHPDPIILDHFNHLIIRRKLNLDYHGLKELHDMFNQAIQDVGQDHDVLVIDLARHIPQEKEFIADAVHYNDTGSQLAAELISREVYTKIIQGNVL
jgi:hypothetical protein